MALEHHFYMDTPASRHELRDTLVNAGIGFEADPDFENISQASTPATHVIILDVPIDWDRPDNGVIATRAITFRDTWAYLDRPEFEGQFDRDTTLGIVALLRAYPNADAYWLSYDAAIPTLRRRGGRLVLAQALTENGSHWDPERQPYRAMVDLPYVVEPLGPWADVPNDVDER